MSSSFLDEARTEAQWKTRTPCGVGVLLASLSAAERADVEAALDDPSISGAAIARVLNRRYESTVSAWSLQRHRTRVVNPNGCHCE